MEKVSKSTKKTKRRSRALAKRELHGDDAGFCDW
jgi:hypothetical protein